jgi:hypothetical protein
VERVDEGRAGEQLARRFFAPAEVRALGTLPEAARARRFLQYWTLNEAYLKARGLGLSIALDGFWFVLEAGAPIVLRFAGPLDDDPRAGSSTSATSSRATCWRWPRRSGPVRARRVGVALAHLLEAATSAARRRQIDSRCGPLKKRS